ncbi:hypothetical protein SLEP1_g57154 [Rubroshorea leprosula]|uniref:Uncharacterized protein n=1 Tax=Rubroshorea leprosula TaxID=152421 RepID=A0AAV5MKD9_9ROSI|nr:hypothetical protein SLEP1_g57154 [Rubroshorea leprosula]
MGVKEDTDEVTVKMRILSLELLQGLLEGDSNSFTKNFHFIDSVKSRPFLCFVVSFSFAVSCHISDMKTIANAVIICKEMIQKR